MDLGGCSHSCHRVCIPATGRTGRQPKPKTSSTFCSGLEPGGLAQLPAGKLENELGPTAEEGFRRQGETGIQSRFSVGYLGSVSTGRGQQAGESELGPRLVGRGCEDWTAATTEAQ